MKTKDCEENVDSRLDASLSNSEEYIGNEYGGDSKIVNAFVQNIMYLSVAAEPNEISATLVHRQFNDQGTTVFYRII